ncbi:MAG: rod shape-determining protein MreC, partial [Candidatus Syntrophonatronum acetioxidans]
EKLRNYQGLTHQLEELRQENKRLRDMLDFQERSNYDLIPAKIIARDPSTWFNTLIINKGYNDGVARDMAVTTQDGLVGNVMAVSRHASKVLLLTDSRRAVSGVVQGSRDMGTIGFVEGSVDEPGYCRMINISREAEISRDDVIISSGLGGVFPPGLVIGEVMEVGRDEYGLLKSALIKPAVNFNRLEEVFVVNDTGEEVLEEEFEFNDDLMDNEEYQEETEGQEYNGQN